MKTEDEKEDNHQNTLYNADTEEMMYDDACDVGQFCLNPCWFVFSKASQYCHRRSKRRLRLHAHPAPAAGTASSVNTSMPSSSVVNNDQHTEAKMRRTTRIQQCVYCVAVFGSWTVIFDRFYPLCWVQTEETCPKYHLWLGYAVYATCALSWRLASYTSPGHIINTPESLDKYDNYRFDNLLYLPHKTCSTVLGMRKLARSKYDRYTHRHIPRFDHFCGWINQSVGEENYRYFLVFLAIHMCMCIYGAILIPTILLRVVAVEAQQPSPTAESLSWLGVDSIDSWVALVSIDYGLTAVTLLMSIVSILLTAFLSFHVKLSFKGMTTNEYFKWKLIQKRHEKATAEYLMQQQQEQHNKPRDASALSQHTVGQEAFTNNPETRNSHHGHCVANPGHFPTNIYDLGFAANIHEVICPRSLRRLQVKSQRHKIS